MSFANHGTIGRPKIMLPSNLPSVDVGSSEIRTVNSVSLGSCRNNNNNSSNGFDLINHAIRMEAPGPVLSTSHLGAKTIEVCQRNSEFLLKARLLEQQRGLIPINTAGGGPSVRHNVDLRHAHASAIVAAAARRASVVRHQQQHQLSGPGGIVPALQRRHHTLPPLPTVSGTTTAELHRRSSLLRTSPDPHEYPPPTQQSSTAATTTTTITTPSIKQSFHTMRAAGASQESQEEQNARQLNPNAFQFPWKLHDMLDRSKIEGNEDLVSWVDNGKAFRVHLTDVFVENIMPRFFKQTKYKSFQRQLNLYGFTRLHNGPNKGGYKHKYFRQGQRTMCQLIIRCPIRDSSSAATSTVAEVVVSKEGALNDPNSMKISNEMIIDDDNIDNDNTTSVVTIDAKLNQRLTPPSSISTSSKEASSSPTRMEHEQQQHQQSDALMRNQEYRNQQVMAATSKQNLSNALDRIRRQEQQLHQLRAQQCKNRLHQLQQLQKGQGPHNNALVNGSTLARIDHSKLPQVPMISRMVSLDYTCLEKEAATGSNVQNNRVTLDGSSNPSADDSRRGGEKFVAETKGNADATVSAVIAPVSAKSNKNSTGNEKRSMGFPKEFQFPWKLYEMLQRADERNFSDVVSWMPGLCFKVHDVGSFVKLVMPYFFKQTKYKSFQRQLNLYGFTRVDFGHSKGGYRHPQFIKGKKHLLTSIVRIKIRGNGRTRSEKVSIINQVCDSSCVNNPNSRGENNNIAPTMVPQSSKAIQAQSTLSWKNTGTSKENPSVTPTSVVPRSPGTSSEKGSGIDIILEAIKARERKDGEVSTGVQNKEDIVIDIADSSSSSSNTIPSTIDVNMKDKADDKNAYGLSWRLHRSESYSDWTIEVVSGDISPPIIECTSYHVHRRVLAVGPKKSDYFANIFKLNGFAGQNQLRLSKRQAAVFPMVLDFIYTDIDLDLDAEKAYALYSLGEKLENEAILRSVTDFYSKWCMTKENIFEFIKLGQSFKNEILLEAAILRFSEEIWSIDIETAAELDPGLLYKVLILVLAQDQDTAKCMSVHLSQIIAACVSSATRITLTPEIFRSLTDKSLVPSIDPIAAIKLLATENTILNGAHESPAAGDLSLHERCASAIHTNWGTLRQCLEESVELANTMRSISSIVLFDILMKTKIQGVASDASIAF